MKLSEFIKNHDVELTEEQEKKLKELLDIKNKKKWVPIEREKYYTITGYGDVNLTSNIDDCTDRGAIKLGNYFRNEEEAQFRLQQIKVYHQLKNFAEENNDEINWNDTSQCKYIINYDTENKKFEYNFFKRSKAIGLIYFSSKELVEQAIKKVGEERIKKYLFGVE